MEDLKQRIIDAAIAQFAESGLKFTMDDIAKRMRVSKKTLYAAYTSKEELLLDVAAVSFADIKESEKRIAEDDSLDPVEKLSRILGVLPEKYTNIGLSNLYQLREKFPRVYTKVEEYLSTDWDTTERILNSAIETGLVRPVSVPIFKTVFESTLAAYMEKSVLVENGISYEEGLRLLIDMLLNGIRVRQEEKL